MKAILVNTPKGQYVLTCEQIAHATSAFPIYYPAFLEDVKRNPVGELMILEESFLRRLVIQGGIPMDGFNDFNGEMQPLPPDAEWWKDENNFKVVELEVKVLEPEFTGAQTEVTC